jgi:hypothetical protein
MNRKLLFNLFRPNNLGEFNAESFNAVGRIKREKMEAFS